MSTFVAQFYGECADCGQNMKGREVTYRGSDIVHVQCPPSLVEAPKDTPLCTSCFTYHRGECL